MSFWRTFGFHTISPVENILDKEEFTLEELLDEDELVQETKSQNKKLIEFLVKPETLQRLIAHLTTEPSDESADPRRKYKYANVAAEVFCSEVWTIYDAVFEEANLPLLDALFRFLEPDTDQSPVIVGLSCKVIGVFLTKKGAETLEVLKKREGIIGRALVHLSNAAVMDLLLKVIASDGFREASMLEWLRSEKFVEQLVSKLDPEQSAEVHENAAQALSEVISASDGAASVLIDELESKAIVGALFEHVLSCKSESTLLHSLTVLINLLARSSSAELDEQKSIDDLPPVYATARDSLPKFSELLLRPPNARQYAMSYGPHTALGFARLKLVEFLFSLVKANYKSVNAALAESGALAASIELFFQYPWHNFLHSCIEQMVLTIFKGTDSAFQTAVVKECKLVDRIVAASAENEEECKTNHKHARRGYMAFITIIAEALCALAGRNSDVSSYLGAHDGWKAFVAGALAESRALDNTPMGRKPLSIGDSSEGQDENDAEFDKNPAQLVFTQYLAQQGFSNIYPEEYNEDDDFDHDAGDGVFESENDFEPRGIFAADERQFNLDDIDAADRSSGSDSDNDAAKDATDGDEKKKGGDDDAAGATTAASAAAAASASAAAKKDDSGSAGGDSANATDNNTSTNNIPDEGKETEKENDKGEKEKEKETETETETEQTTTTKKSTDGDAEMDAVADDLVEASRRIGSDDEPAAAATTAAATPPAADITIATTTTSSSDSTASGDQINSDAAADSSSSSSTTAATDSSSDDATATGIAAAAAAAAAADASSSPTDSDAASADAPSEEMSDASPKTTNADDMETAEESADEADAMQS